MVAKSNIIALLVGAIILLSAFTTFQSTNWQVAEGYTIRFTSKDPSGIFAKKTGDISFDENKLDESKFTMTVEVASINTGSGMKNKHAKNEKWFDAKQFPYINFVSDKFTKTASGYQVTGTLEMHGVKKEVSIPFTFANNTFIGSFNVNRLDYKVGGSTGMSGKASTDIKIDLSVPVSKK